MTKRFLQGFLRLTVLGLLRCFYRLRVRNQWALPAEGGALLTPNHASYLDVLILSAASPRPIRFLMDRDWYQRPWIGRFARFFGAIPVSRTRAKEAVRASASALRAGEIVCVFPEGRFTRDGQLAPLQPGYQLIARQADVPVIPVHLEGLWGSAFSHAPGSRLAKACRTLARGVEVRFGDRLEPHSADVLTLEAKLLALRFCASPSQ